MSTVIPGRRASRGYSTGDVKVTVSSGKSSGRVTFEASWEGHGKFGKVTHSQLLFLDRKAFIAAALEQMYALELAELGISLPDLKKLLEFYRGPS